MIGNHTDAHHVIRVWFWYIVILICSFRYQSGGQADILLTNCGISPFYK